MLMWRDISAFHRKFKLKQRKYGEKPSRALVRYRLKFLLEEIDEFAKAAQKNDLVGMTDALVDLAYVTLGTAWLLNLPFPRSWTEVQLANMRKELAGTAERSKRGEPSDIIKPEGWTPPNISQFLPSIDRQLKTPEPRDEEQYDLVNYLQEMGVRPEHEQDNREQTK